MQYTNQGESYTLDCNKLLFIILLHKAYSFILKLVSNIQSLTNMHHNILSFSFNEINKYEKKNRNVITS